MCSLLTSRLIRVNSAVCNESWVGSRSLSDAQPGKMVNESNLVSVVQSNDDTIHGQECDQVFDACIGGHSNAFGWLSGPVD